MDGGTPILRAVVHVTRDNHLISKCSGHFSLASTRRLAIVSGLSGYSTTPLLGKEQTRKRLSAYGVMMRGSWAWVELNYRPHAYQATEWE